MKQIAESVGVLDNFKDGIYLGFISGSGLKIGGFDTTIKLNVCVKGMDIPTIVIIGNGAAKCYNQIQASSLAEIMNKP